MQPEFIRRMLTTALLSGVLAGLCPNKVRAQDSLFDSNPEERWAYATWVDDMGFAAVNGVLSGVGAGLIQWMDGGSFKDGFTRGAAGGAVVFGGKRLAAARFDGAGFLGRSVGSIGASMSRNASNGAPLLSALTLPVGPLWVHWDREQGGLSAKVDLAVVYWTAYGALEDRLKFDLGRSLSAGAPVFLTEGVQLRSGGEDVDGLFVGGILVVGSGSETRVGDIAAHERTHLLQNDHFTILYGQRLEQEILDWIGGPLPSIGRRVHLSLGSIATSPYAWARAALPRKYRNQEMEADYFEIRSRPKKNRR